MGRAANVTVFLDDGDVRLYLGDALETLRTMADESVDCVVTSPPYWGLRDYGTGLWEGGDPDCDHVKTPPMVAPERYTPGGAYVFDPDGRLFRDVCGKCGATRQDQQMGLEPTPDLFVEGMTVLFREIRRVLAAHGTCWVNLGDSYASSGGHTGQGETSQRQGRSNIGEQNRGSYSTVVDGLKPKDLVGIPWRVAFALQQDGWYLRSDIIWAKPNPMPESVTDRPTKSHEYVFLLTKQPRYWFDAEAVREPNTQGSVERFGKNGSLSPPGKWDGQEFSLAAARARMDKVDPTVGRNVRSVWQIATQPYPEAHFATFPEELARRCILAGCPTRVCRVCGRPSERIVEREVPVDVGVRDGAKLEGNVPRHRGGTGRRLGQAYTDQLNANPRETVGWTDCGHNDWRPGLTLDPFIGSGTVAKVARDHQRHSIGIDLNVHYLELAARRLQQLSLLTETSA